jgi:UDP-glucuronate 4-epimerase
MAPYRFACAIERGEPIDIYNYGKMRRDFTYVEDVAEGVFRVLELGGGGHRLFNLGGSSPVGLMEFVHALEAALGKRARRRFLPMQPGDVPVTHADGRDFEHATGFRPATPLRAGVESFATWFREWSSAGERTETVGAAS